MTEPRPEVRLLPPEEIFHRYLTTLGRAEQAEQTLNRLATAVAWHLDHCAHCPCTLSLLALVAETSAP